MFKYILFAALLVGCDGPVDRAKAARLREQTAEAWLKKQDLAGHVTCADFDDYQCDIVFSDVARKPVVLYCTVTSCRMVVRCEHE